jgi:hypothetical protein
MKTNNYSKNILLIVLIILLILSGIYLYKKNNNDLKIIEKFDYGFIPSTTQQSLSTYFSDIINSDKNISSKKFNNVSNIKQSRVNELNGYWNDDTNKKFMSTLQVNDLLIISINNSEITSTSPYTAINGVSPSYTGTTPALPLTPTNTNCPLNTFTAVFQLNYNRTKFYIKQIYCNTIPNFIISSSNVYGYLNSNTINLKIGSTDYTYTRDTKDVTNSEDAENKNVYDGPSKYNAFNNNLINPYPDVPTSKIYIPYQQDKITKDESKVIIQNTFMPINILSQYNKNSDNSFKNYKLCSLINSIDSTNSINTLIFYVSDLIYAQSLDYQFWGVGKDDSNLVLKDTNLSYELSIILNTLIPAKNSVTRTSPINNPDLKKINKITSFLYCDESNTQNYSTELTNITNSINANPTKPIFTSTSVKPIDWNLKASYSSTVCFVSLSANSDQNNIEKYATFNSDGTTNMSLVDDGYTQSLIVEDYNTIKTDNSSYFIGSGLFRTNDLLYLVPNNSNKTLQGNNTVNLVSKPHSNGKWIIIGYNPILIDPTTIIAEMAL